MKITDPAFLWKNLAPSATQAYFISSFSVPHVGIDLPK